MVELLSSPVNVADDDDGGSGLSVFSIPSGTPRFWSILVVGDVKCQNIVLVLQMNPMRLEQIL